MKRKNRFRKAGGEELEGVWRLYVREEEIEAGREERVSLTMRLFVQQGQGSLAHFPSLSFSP